jgi:hypothetical protein
MAGVQFLPIPIVKTTLLRVGMKTQGNKATGVGVEHI